MTDFFQSLLDFVGQHPMLAVLISFLISLAEGLFVIGLFAPTTTVLFGIGSLIGLGNLPFWPIFVATACGAAAGDVFSYWIGRAYGWRLLAMRPFVRYEGIVREGQRYFAVHGGKSIVIGRFIPGIKSVVPAIGAMSGMGFPRFAALDTVSALSWATVHLVPGVCAGLALAGIGTISKRLAILIAVLIVAGLLAAWLIRRIAAWGARWVARRMAATERWARGRGDFAGGFAMRLVGPEHGDFRVLVILCAIILAAMFAFMALLEFALTRGAEGLFDLSISQFLQSLRTSWSDAVMVPVTMLGDAPVLYAVALAGIAILVGAREYRLAGGFCIAAASAAPFVRALKPLVGAERPLELYSGADLYSFPSGHASGSAVIYGILGLVLWHGIGGRIGRAAGAGCVALVLAISFSRVYFGAHWPSDVLAGLMFGAAVVAAFALVFRADLPERRVSEWLAAGTLTALLATGSWHIGTGRLETMAFYAARPRAEVTMEAPWRDGGWEALPDHRIDLVGGTGQPIILQWRGSTAALRESLAAQGWTTPPAWTIVAVNRFVVSGTRPTDLPALPRFHRGMAPALTMVLPIPAGGDPGRLVLRAWPEIVVGPSGSTDRVLIAAVFTEAVVHPASQLSIPVPDDDVTCVAVPSLAELPGAEMTGLTLLPAEAGCGGPLVLAGPEPGLTVSADPVRGGQPHPAR